MIPPIFSIACLTKANPKPVPELLVVKFGTNMRSLKLSGMPLPLSLMVTSILLLVTMPLMVIMPSLSSVAASMAFLSKLLNDLSSWSLSARIKWFFNSFSFEKYESDIYRVIYLRSCIVTFCWSWSENQIDVSSHLMKRKSKSIVAFWWSEIPIDVLVSSHFDEAKFKSIVVLWLSEIQIDISSNLAN